MKTVVISLLFLLLASCLSLSELTKDDLREVQKMFDKQEENMKMQEQRIKEYMQSEIRATKAELMQEIAKLDAKIAKVDAKVAKVDAKVDGVDAKVDAMREGQAYLKWLIGILAAVVIGGIALPSILIAWIQRRREKESEQIQQQNAKQFEQIQRQLDKMSIDFQSLQQEVDQLKKKYNCHWALTCVQYGFFIV